jgi:Holliday junction DNA helicase RuvB
VSFNDVNDVRPSALRHLIGNVGVIAQVATEIEAAFADNRKFDSAMLVGGPGLGKSQLASVIAQEMAVDFVEVLGQSLTDAGELNGLLLGMKDKAICHIDEAHLLPKEQATALYIALDQRKVILSSRTKSGPQAIPIADFTVLLSTTDEYGLLQPLRDRMKLVLRFDYYTTEELAEVVRQRSRALSWPVDAEVIAEIAQRGRGVPRLALRLLSSCRRVCRSVGEGTINPDHLRRACELEGLDHLGLGPTEQRYLSILAEEMSRLNVIASRIGLPPRTISQVTESFLIRIGLVVKDDQGRRQLTAAGREHVARLRNEQG